MQSRKTPSYNQFQLHFAAGLISSWDPIASQALFHIQHPMAGASVGHPHTPSKNKVTKWGQQARLPQNTTKTSHHHAELHLGVRERQRC